MQITTKAIVINAIKYAEADLIVKLFTEKSGIKSYLLRGILKSKRGTKRASQFQALTQLDIVARHKEKGTLENLKEAKVTYLYKSLHTDIVKSTIVMFLAEVLKSAIQEEETNPKLFSFLEESLQWFDVHENTNFHLLFMLKLTRYLGFYPEFSNSENEYFNLLDGTFQDVETNVYCIKGDSKRVLVQLLGINFDELEKVKLNQASRQGVLTLLLNYYELHLQGFRTPKSLTILKEIYS